MRNNKILQTRNHLLSKNLSMAERSVTSLSPEPIIQHSKTNKIEKEFQDVGIMWTLLLPYEDNSSEITSFKLSKKATPNKRKKKSTWYKKSAQMSKKSDYSFKNK